MQTREYTLNKGTDLGITMFDPNRQQSGGIAVGIIMSKASNTFCISIYADPALPKADIYNKSSNGVLTIEQFTQALDNMEKTVKNDLLQHPVKGKHFTSLSIQFSHDQRCNLFSKKLTREIVEMMLQTARETALYVANETIERNAKTTCRLI